MAVFHTLRIEAAFSASLWSNGVVWAGRHGAKVTQPMAMSNDARLPRKDPGFMRNLSDASKATTNHVGPLVTWNLER